MHVSTLASIFVASSSTLATADSYDSWRILASAKNAAPFPADTHAARPTSTTPINFTSRCHDVNKLSLRDTWECLSPTMCTTASPLCDANAISVHLTIPRHFLMRDSMERIIASGFCARNDRSSYMTVTESGLVRRGLNIPFYFYTHLPLSHGVHDPP